MVFSHGPTATAENSLAAPQPTLKTPPGMLKKFAPALISAILLVAVIDKGSGMLDKPTARNIAMTTVYSIGLVSSIWAWWRSKPPTLNCINDGPNKRGQND